MNHKTHITEIEIKSTAALYKTDLQQSSLEHETRYYIQKFSGYLKMHCASLVISLEDKLQKNEFFYFSYDLTLRKP